MANNDNWNDFDLDSEEGFTDAWDEVKADDFQDIEVDIPEPVSVSSDLEGASKVEEESEIEIPVFNTERPVRKVTPRRDYDDDDDDDDDDDEEDYEDKKGKGVTILIIVISLLVIGALIFLAIKLVGESNDTNSSTETTTEATIEATTAAWELNANSEVVSLINSYYAARTLVDTYTLKSLVDSSITIDEVSLANEAAVVEGYQDITCYISEGQTTGDWICYVSYAIKFKNIATPAPGLVAHYIKTDESGSLRIIPWEYVQKNNEIFDFIAEASDCEAITTLAEEINTNYKKALESDEDLKAYIVGITGTEELTTETPTTEPATEPTTETPTTKASSGEETGFTDCDTMMYITKDKVNVRKKPTTDSDVIGSLMTGDYIQITGKGNEWYRICTKDGKTGYVKKDFFSNNKPVATTNN